MVISRGGNVTGRNGSALSRAQLQATVRAYLSLEKENSKHTVYFKRDRIRNGIFADIDTSKRNSVPQIVEQLVRVPEFEPSLHKFFLDLLSLVKEDGFIDDYSTIAMEAPEIREEFIHESFVHVGESVNQKNIWAGLMKVLEMESVLYHAVASSADGQSLYILSNQRASQVRDENTRNKTEYCEKPRLAEYLVMM